MTEDSVDGDGPSRFHTRHDWGDGDCISTTVINAVAAVVGKAPSDLQPLYDAIDPDALDSLLRSFRCTEAGGDRAVVAFRFDECEVTVESDGTIWIELAE